MTDLTKITTPFGLLDRETQEALRAHGGPYQCFAVSNGAGWHDGESWGKKMDDFPALAWRVQPAPPRPREWWIIGGCEAYSSLADAEEASKSLQYEQGPVHVREVLK